MDDEERTANDQKEPEPEQANQQELDDLRRSINSIIAQLEMMGTSLDALVDAIVASRRSVPTPEPIEETEAKTIFNI